MKHLLVTTFAALVTLGSLAIAGSIHVENVDSRDHVIKLKCSGSEKTVEIKRSTTATYTFHSTHKECDIIGGTITFPTSKLVEGQKWRFKDGKAIAR